MDVTSRIKWTVRCQHLLCEAVGIHLTGMLKKPLVWYCPDHKDEEIVH